jgi:DNA-directed RNA polymerase specialized sigma24 family protein
VSYTATGQAVSSRDGRVVTPSVTGGWWRHAAGDPTPLNGRITRLAMYKVCTLMQTATVGWWCAVTGRQQAGRESTDDGAQPTQPNIQRRLRLVNEETYGDWEAIHRDNVERLYRLIYATVGNRADAEDLTTEVFLAATRPLRTSASVAEVRACLLATARTVLTAHWRRTLGREITTLESEDVAEVLTGPPANDQAESEAQEILATLPPIGRSSTCASPRSVTRTAARRFFRRALTVLKVTPSEVVIDATPIYAVVLEELIPSAWHHVERYANSPIEADHSQLKHRVRPICGLPTVQTAQTIIAVHAFLQNLMGMYELAIDAPATKRLATAFTEHGRCERGQLPVQGQSRPAHHVGQDAQVQGDPLGVAVHCSRWGRRPSRRPTDGRMASARDPDRPRLRGRARPVRWRDRQQHRAALGRVLRRVQVTFGHRPSMELIDYHHRHSLEGCRADRVNAWPSPERLPLARQSSSSTRQCPPCMSRSSSGPQSAAEVAADHRHRIPVRYA